MTDRTHDLQGREYARYSQLEDGLLLTCDDDFTCLSSKKQHRVIKDEHGFHVMCGSGIHRLDHDEGDWMVGWYRSES